MNTQTPSGDVPLRHQAVRPAVRRCPQAGPDASARQPAGRLPSACATKALRLKPRCSRAAHGYKALLAR
jgi:hypothetical protein